MPNVWQLTLKDDVSEEAMCHGDRKPRYSKVGAPMSEPGMTQARGMPTTAMPTVPQKPSQPSTCGQRSTILA